MTVSDKIIIKISSDEKQELEELTLTLKGIGSETGPISETNVPEVFRFNPQFIETAAFSVMTLIGTEIIKEAAKKIIAWAFDKLTNKDDQLSNKAPQSNSIVINIYEQTIVINKNDDQINTTDQLIKAMEGPKL